MADNNTQVCKETAVQFLQLVVAGRIDEAYEEHVDLRGKHHNPFFAAGFPALREAMKEDNVRSPNKRIAVQHVLGDGDLVALHSHIVTQRGEAAYSTVHVLRFKNEKIVELWDIGQPVPTDSPNKDGAF